MSFGVLSLLHPLLGEAMLQPFPAARRKHWTKVASRLDKSYAFSLDGARLRRVCFRMFEYNNLKEAHSAVAVPPSTISRVHRQHGDPQPDRDGAHGRSDGIPEGHVTQRTVDYYADRARGGTGLIVVEATYPDDVASKGEDGQLGASNNSQTPGLRWLAEAIHDHYGTKAVVQLNHQGMQMCLTDRCASWGPSDIVVSWAGQDIHLHGMSKEDILFVEQAYATAAWRVKMAGLTASRSTAPTGTSTTCS